MTPTEGSADAPGSTLTPSGASGGSLPGPSRATRVLGGGYGRRARSPELKPTPGEGREDPHGIIGSLGGAQTMAKWVRERWL